MAGGGGNANVGSIAVELTADTQQFIRGIGDATEQFSKLTDAIYNFAVGNVLKSLSSGLLNAAKAFSDAEFTAKKFDLAIKNLGYSDATAGLLNDLATELSKISKFDDDALVEAETGMLRIGVAAKDIGQLLPGIVDVASTLGLEVADVAAKIAKAVKGGESRGLKELGIVFDEVTKKAFASGTELQRTQIILKTFEVFSGGAQKSMESSAAAMANFAKVTGDLEESFGGIIDKPIAAVFNVISDVATVAKTALDLLPEPIKDATGSLMIFGSVAVGVLSSMTIMTKIAPILSGVFLAMSANVTKLYAVVKSLGVGLLALSTPILVVASAIGAVVVGIGAASRLSKGLGGNRPKSASDKNDNGLMSSTKDFFYELKESFKEGGSQIKNKFLQVVEPFTSALSDDRSANIKNIQDDLGKQLEKIYSTASATAAGKSSTNKRTGSTDDSVINIDTKALQEKLFNEIDVKDFSDALNVAAQNTDTLAFSFESATGALSDAGMRLQSVGSETLTPTKATKGLGDFGKEFANKNAQEIKNVQDQIALSNSLERSKAFADAQRHQETIDLWRGIGSSLAGAVGSAQVTRTENVLDASGKPVLDENGKPKTQEVTRQAAPVLSNVLAASGDKLMQGDFLGAGIAAVVSLITQTKAFGEILAALEPIFSKLVGIFEMLLEPLIPLFEVIGEVVSVILEVMTKLTLFKVVMKVLGYVIKGIVYFLKALVWYWVKIINFVIRLINLLPFVDIPLIKLGDSAENAAKENNQAADQTEKFTEALKDAVYNVPQIFKRQRYFLDAYNDTRIDSDGNTTSASSAGSGVNTFGSLGSMTSGSTYGTIRQALNGVGGTQQNQNAAYGNAVIIQNATIQSVESPEDLYRKIQRVSARATTAMGLTIYTPSRGTR